MKRRLRGLKGSGCGAGGPIWPLAEVENIRAAKPNASAGRARFMASAEYLAELRPSVDEHAFLQPIPQKIRRLSREIAVERALGPRLVAHLGVDEPDAQRVARAARRNGCAAMDHAVTRIGLAIGRSLR